MERTPDTSQISAGSRAERYVSHALIEVRWSKWWPFGIRSAVLLDLSLQGFKLELTNEWDVRAGQHLWLTIPLTPLGIQAPGRFSCAIECRWFDRNRYRMGGIYSNLSGEDKEIVEKIIYTLREKKNFRSSRVKKAASNLA
ncbi:MAG: PilZ domain-containing protein [Zetaproteobacteria bacterium]|nr:PilZ domain-containing protein [Zetaproteobacteria bacterium]